MSKIERAVELLLPWKESRTPGDARHTVAAWAARSLVQYFVIERLAIIMWGTMNDAHPHYRYSFNFISDLGATMCQPQDPTTQYGRWVCSPLFPVVNLSFMFLGVGVIVTAALITGDVLKMAGRRLNPGEVRETKQPTAWQHKTRELTTQIMRVTLGIAGLGLIGVGSWPEDYNPTMHGNSTGAFLIFGVISLILLGFLWVRQDWISAAWIFTSAAVATVGGGMMLVLNHDNPTPDAVLGTWERLVVYGFIAGMFFMGYTLSNGPRAGRFEAARAKAKTGADSVVPLLTLSAHAESTPSPDFAAKLFAGAKDGTSADQTVPAAGAHIPEAVPVRRERLETRTYQQRHGGGWTKVSANHKQIRTTKPRPAGRSRTTTRPESSDSNPLE
ncbi:DUF998 domain-containing protein [Pseudarthrobacter sp. TAF60_1]|uniref:DUF998 domain-containing protein n=1 Tax=Pseudarthrobacter sp. TAF60_1 TaxID=3233071 RepID=UPI003F9C52A3